MSVAVRESMSEVLALWTRKFSRVKLHDEVSYTVCCRMTWHKTCFSDDDIDCNDAADLNHLISNLAFMNCTNSLCQ